MTVREFRPLALTLDIVLRLAVRDDLPKLEWFGQYTHFRQLFRRAFLEQEKGQRLMLLADCGGFPIGHVFIQFNTAGTSLVSGRSRAYFYAFRVMEMFRRRGIGSALLDEAETIVRERGYDGATIAVAKDNDAARRLYERRQYTIIGDDPGRWSYRDHRGVTRQVDEPCWLMEKRLLLH